MASYIAAAVIGLFIIVGAACLSWRLEWKSLLIFIALASSAVIYTGHAGVIPVVSMPFILGGVGGLSFKKEKSVEFYLVATTAILVVLTAGFFYYYFLIEKINFFEMQREVIAKSLDEAQVPADLRGQWLEAFDASKYIVPFGIVANSVALSAIAYPFIKYVLTRLFGARRPAGIEYFRINEYFIFAMMSGLAVYLLFDKGDYELVHFAGLNVLLIAALFYFIQGLAVVKFLLLRRGKPTFIIVLIFVGLLFFGYIGLWALLFLSVLLTGLGALDLWADFRKLAKNDGIKS